MPNRPVRALVVDDHPDTAESLARLLQTMGCAATFVVDPAKAIDAAAALEAEVVFLDIGMPSIDGYELARMLRKKYDERILLVAVSGYGSDDHHRRSREAGFDAHVQKPVDMKIVESMLATVLASRRGRAYPAR
jgi:CheY-like chemotaxis protein